MKGKIRVIVSIVISAVLLGLIVSYCITEWIPTELLGWILWVAGAILGICAIYRITKLAPLLKDIDKE